MSSIGSARNLFVDHCVSRAVRVIDGRKFIRLIAVALGVAWLAGCAQSSVTRQSAAVAPTRQAALEHEHYRSTHIATEHVSVVRRHVAAVSEKPTGGSQRFSQGVASFYTEDQQTASGEKFDTHKLTAAHPTLPFGTRLRVTNVATGKSVTVRVNDRGPYVPGRVVDVSYSAAEALGMTEKGLAKVRLDVVR